MIRVVEPHLLIATGRRHQGVGAERQGRHDGLSIDPTLRALDILEAAVLGREEPHPCRAGWGDGDGLAIGADRHQRRPIPAAIPRGRRATRRRTASPLQSPPRIESVDAFETVQLPEVHLVFGVRRGGVTVGRGGLVVRRGFLGQLDGHQSLAGRVGDHADDPVSR